MQSIRIDLRHMPRDAAEEFLQKLYDENAVFISSHGGGQMRLRSVEREPRLRAGDLTHRIGMTVPPAIDDGPRTADGQPKPRIIDQCIGREDDRSADNVADGDDSAAVVNGFVLAAVRTATKIIDQAGVGTTPLQAHEIACELHRQYELSRRGD